MNAIATLWYRRSAIVLGCLVLVLLSLPGWAIVQLWDAITAMLPWADTARPDAQGGDKPIHFLLFFAWALAVRRGWPRAPSLTLFAGLFAAAVLTESIQTLVPGRAADLADGAADMGGALLGLLLGGLVRQRQA